MAKKIFFYRYLLILRKLQSNKYPTFKQVESYIYQKAEEDGMDIAFSHRTWIRDKKELQQLCNIEIKYSNEHKGYYIEEDDDLQSQHFMRMLEAFDVFNVFNMSQDFKTYIDINQRPPQGTENLYIFLHSIKNKIQIIFTYQKFGGMPKQYTLSPYMLKEFKNRWYIIGEDSFDEKIKTFALDRLSEVEVLKRTFQLPQNFDPKVFFKYCFGIIRPEKEKLETIVLSFDPFQGKYIKTLPLHHTQKILVDNKEELCIQVQLYPTHDFKMELLSMGGNVKVLSPQSFADEIKNDLQWALENYNS